MKLQKKLDNWLVKSPKPSTTVNVKYRKGACHGCGASLLFERKDWLKSCEKCGVSTLDDIREEFVYVLTSKPCNRLHRVWGLRTWFLCDCCGHEYIIGSTVREMYGQMVYMSVLRPKDDEEKQKKTDSRVDSHHISTTATVFLTAGFTLCVAIFLFSKYIL